MKLSLGPTPLVDVNKQSQDSANITWESNGSVRAKKLLDTRYIIYIILYFPTSSINFLSRQSDSLGTKFKM